MMDARHHELPVMTCCTIEMPLRSRCVRLSAEISPLAAGTFALAMQICFPSKKVKPSRGWARINTADHDQRRAVRQRMSGKRNASKLSRAEDALRGTDDDGDGDVRLVRTR